MSYLVDALYLLALIALSPWLIWKAITTGKYRRGLPAKLFGWTVRRREPGPCVWFHGVSVGEIHLLRTVVGRFRQRHPDWQCVVTTTTDTGLAEARKHFPDLLVCYWPFDYSWAVRRALRRIKPTLIVLAEVELWPNFLAAARRRRIPVVVVNGRMSPRSFRNYQRLGWLARRMLRKVSLFAVQTEEYAAGLRALGLPNEKIHVTGSVKYDGVTADRANPKTEELRRLFAVQRGDRVLIVGSTQAPEEDTVLGIFQRVRAEQPTLRLFLVPRQKERFDEVAALLHRSDLPFVRRSELTGPVTDRAAVVLVDTIGELGALWGLADVAFVGGSMDGKRGGQNMIEPAAYGAAVVFGPHVWNFRETAAKLIENEAAVQVADGAALETVIRRLLSQAGERQRLGTAARWFVQQQQGATERTMELLDPFLGGQANQDKAA